MVLNTISPPLIKIRKFSKQELRALDFLLPEGKQNNGEIGKP